MRLSKSTYPLINGKDKTIEMDRHVFPAKERDALFAHGIREPIFACHRAKTPGAVADEA